MPCEIKNGSTMEPLPVDESYVDEDYCKIKPVKPKKSLEEIRSIINKHNAKLQARLTQIEEDYPSTSGQLLDMLIDI